MTTNSFDFFLPFRFLFKNPRKSVLSDSLQSPPQRESWCFICQQILLARLVKPFFFYPAKFEATIQITPVGGDAIESSGTKFYLFSIYMYLYISTAEAAECERFVFERRYQ